MKKQRDELYFGSLLSRARVYALTGEHTRASADYLHAKEIAKDVRSKILSELGYAEMLLREGKPERSSTVLKRSLRCAKARKIEKVKGAILNGLCNAKIMESKTKHAEHYARQALSFYQNMRCNSQEKKKGIAESLNNLGGVYSSRGQLKQALRYYERSYSARSIHDREGMAISLNNIGVTYMDLRKYHKALTYLRRSLEMRKTMGYVYGIGLCSSNIAIVYWKQGKYEEAIHFAGENLEYQMRLGDKKGIATSLNNIGVIHKIHGEYKKALECHRKSYRIRREIGDRFGMTINLNQMGNIFLKMGEYGSALKANREEGNLCREMKNHPRLMNYYGLRANILVELQHYAAAYGYRERSLKINRELNLTLDEARDLTAMSHIIIISYLSGRKLRVPPEKAKKFLSRSLGIAKENHHWFEYSIVLSRFAMFNAMKKQHKKAMEQISEAEQICTENGFREFEPEVLFCKARILEMGGEKEAALKYLKRSKEGSKKLGLNPLVKKIDVLMKKMDGKKGISNQKIVIKGDWA